MHDPLHVNALVARDAKGTTLVLISADLCVIDTPIASSIRRKIARKLEIPVPNVILSATHSHSSPWLVRGRNASRPADRKYCRFTEDTIVETALRASALTCPASMFFRETSLGLGYNRRVRKNNATLNCWGPQEYPERQPGPMPDPACSMLMFRQTSGARCSIAWSLGVHPVVLGKTSNVISADYPGLANTQVEQLLPDAKSMFVLGAAGNIHPWIATQEDPGAVETVARAASSMIALLAKAGAPLLPSPLRAASRSVKLIKTSVDVVAWQIGPVRIVALPVEFFGELGAHMRDETRHPLFLATNSNGWLGYLPTREAFTEGGYEVEGAKRLFRPGDGEKLAVAAATLANEL